MYFCIMVKFKATSDSLTNQILTYPMGFQIETDRLKGYAALFENFKQASTVTPLGCWLHRLESC